MWPNSFTRCRFGFVQQARDLFGPPSPQNCTVLVHRGHHPASAGASGLLDDGRQAIESQRKSAYRNIQLYFAWYNDRPHLALHGATPDEVYFARRPACRAPRFEPRAGWPRASPCAMPRTLVKGQPGVQLSVQVTFVAGRRHLPRVTLTRAA